MDEPIRRFGQIMVPHPTGPWVRYEAVAALLSVNDHLSSALSGARAAIDRAYEHGKADVRGYRRDADRLALENELWLDMVQHALALFSQADAGHQRGLTGGVHAASVGDGDS